ncbi:MULTISPECIES: amino acid ABC transporter permease [unclassified Pseudomonas]|jgi:polar amino acid transport system permease protein|uniref:amino acid ABC transporter permease n=1 Tax=unclassified Pseudomonas TaxID=196821 RepID=UPI001911DB1F|nr:MULTISPECIES: amino acid ABC transporter permease [unclassified Pseudomonas]MBK5418615.1 amino acid ABC transporter permease [Pseudomonas sp. TH31]MBK5549123.1 amino acid ABC transporter permease [Pseudomonas sp. TH03]MEB0225757.1 amino acid ABC transporter permease [Pseudomonas sp. 5S1]MEB0293444.1 amino acid ABC transporter permease [Pseudomonas sp. 10S4]WPX17354.1 amino acid ABC transporter permease [Pseudomonas sp. 10S4]
MFDWPLFLQNLPLLLTSLLVTLEVSTAALVIGFFIGILVASLRLSPVPLFRRLGGGYIFVFRGIPLLVQLLFVYYFLPRVGLPNVSPLTAAIISLSLCAGAYIAEILRGGFLAIPGGQLEAAGLLGMSTGQMLIRIRVPQAVRLTLPALVNEMILLIKASSLVSVVGLADLTRTAQNLAASDYLFVQDYLMLAGFYCLINIPLAFCGGLLERRMKEQRS